MANASTVITVDFSDVKESSGINPKNQPEGDYLARIVKAEMTKTKEGQPMALICFQDANLRSAVYPYYCTFQANMLWKIRNAFIAAGVPVPKGKGKIDIAKLVNKEVGITLEDDEYDGKPKSVISAVFHKDELEPVEAEDDDYEVEEDEVEEEEEEEAPAPVKKAKKKAEPVVVEEEEEDDEEEEEEEPAPAPVKKKAKAKPAPVVEDDEDDDEDLDIDDL
jgi:hypothetical protein